MIQAPSIVHSKDWGIGKWECWKVEGISKKKEKKGFGVEKGFGALIAYKNQTDMKMEPQDGFEKTNKEDY